MNYYEELARKEESAATVWTIIGVIQIITGVGIICGIWNLIASGKRRKFAKQIRNGTAGDIVKAYENGLTNILIFGALNLFLGAVIGVIGSVYDLSVRSFVLSNKAAFSTVNM